MNKIEKLIKKLCPNGVEYYFLKDVLVKSSGTKITASQMKEIHKDDGVIKIFAGGKTFAMVNPEDIPENDVIDRPSIIVKSRGIIEFEYYTMPFSHKAEFWSYHSENKNVNIKFIYYLLKNSERYFNDKASVMQMPQISSKDTQNFKIPVPPLEIQEEIVKILDKFTDYVTELTTELTLRQKQYEKYKEELIGFEDKDIKLVALSEIAVYGKKRIDNSEIEDGNYIGVENLLKNKMGVEFKKINLPSGTSIAFYPENILIGNIRPYLKKIYYSDFVGGTNGDVLVIQINEEYKHVVNPRFLYYCLSTDYFFHYMNQNSKGAKMPRGDKSKVLLFEIPLPSISKQTEIVAILDKFYNLSYDLSSGLPKEIELRQKQYEYYRDKLLTFD